MQEKGAIPLLDGVERSLVRAGDVVTTNFPDVTPEVERSLHSLQLVLDGPSEALHLLECLHFGDPLMQHCRCHKHRLQMDDRRRPFEGQVIPHGHPVFQDVLDDDRLARGACLMHLGVVTPKCVAKVGALAF